MIFASVGSMLPFDRLVKAVDEWAHDNPDRRVFIQIGAGTYLPKHAKWERILPHEAYMRLLEQCSLFVAHVGIGSILQGLQLQKQMLLLPRLAARREHTTEHQLHTAGRFKHVQGLAIVDDTASLKSRMTELIHNPLPVSSSIPPFATPELIGKVAAFLRMATI